MADLRQSKKYGQFMEKIGWRVENLDGGQVFIKKLFLIGSIIKVQRPNKLQLDKLDQLAKKHRAIFVKLEPLKISNYQLLITHGYLPDKSPLLPRKTLQIDLTQPEEQIFSQFKKDCRYEIKKAEKNNLLKRSASWRTISATHSLDDQIISQFISLWQQNAWARGFWIPIKKQIQALWKAFGQDASLIMAYYSNDINHWTTPLAGALVIFFNKLAYYFYAASTPEGRKLSAPYLIVWEAIKEAKKRGCQVFDFEGIYDPRFPNKSWLGFSHFKKSFGGKEVEYPGGFIKFYNPIIARLRRLV